VHRDGLDLSVGAKQALEHGGQRPPQQREADDEDGVRSSSIGRRAADRFPSAAIRRLVFFSVACVVVVVPVHFHVQVGLAGRISREADREEEEARREGERGYRSHFALFLFAKGNGERASSRVKRER
jgi:hypothetical protein